MNMKKFLAMTLLAATVLTTTVLPVVADEMNPSFVGIGSDGIAYEDLTLPQTTSDNQDITWSTTTGDVIEIVDNQTAKIKKQYANKAIDANVVATVGDTSTPIAFKVGYLWADKTEKESHIFSDEAVPSNAGIRAGYAGTFAISDGRLKISDESSTLSLDVRYAFGSKYTDTSSKYLVEFDVSIGVKKAYISLAHSSDITKAGLVQLTFDGGAVKAHKGATSTALGLELEPDADGAYNANIKMLVDLKNGCYDLLINNNLVAQEWAVRGSDYTVFRLRFWDDSKSQTGDIYLDNLKVSTCIDKFEGLEKSVLNTGADVDVAEGALTLPETNAAGDSVSWESADTNIVVSGTVGEVKPSYFAERTGTVTATIAGAEVTYLNEYSFTIPKADFPAEATAAVGELTAGSGLEATISGITPVAEGTVTVVVAVYSREGDSVSLADVGLETQSVSTDGTLSVSIDSLKAVPDDPVVKVFVFDKMSTLVPLTTVTIAN